MSDLCEGKLYLNLRFRLEMEFTFSGEILSPSKIAAEKTIETICGEV
jgi:hypothetical protein